MWGGIPSFETAACESWLFCDKLFFDAGSGDLFCAALAWHFYALIKWEGAAGDSENTPSPKVASQE